MPSSNLCFGCFDPWTSALLREADSAGAREREGRRGGVCVEEVRRCGGADERRVHDAAGGASGVQAGGALQRIIMRLWAWEVSSSAEARTGGRWGVWERRRGRGRGEAAAGADRSDGNLAGRGNITSSFFSVAFLSIRNLCSWFSLASVITVRIVVWKSGIAREMRGRGFEDHNR